METNSSILFTPTVGSKAETSTMIQKNGTDLENKENGHDINNEGRFNRVLDKQLDSHKDDHKKATEFKHTNLVSKTASSELQESNTEDIVTESDTRATLLPFASNKDQVESAEALPLEPNTVLTGTVNIDQFKSKSEQTSTNLNELEGIQNKLNMTNSLLAGSLASQSKDNLKENTQLPPLTEVDSIVTDDFNQRSGKLDPLTGKNLPRNLPFFSNESEHNVQTSKISDLINKVTVTNQQIINSLESNNTTQATASSQETMLSNMTNSTATSTKPILSHNLDTPSQLDIKLQAGSNEWNRELGNKIRWMGNINLSKAELKLHPAELGTIEIKIITEDNQTKVNFLTTNSSAKEMIESSLPKLRELLESTGLQLEQSDVSQRNPSNNNSPQHQNSNSESNGNDEMEMSAHNASLVISQTNQSRYDHYV